LVLVITLLAIFTLNSVQGAAPTESHNEGIASVAYNVSPEQLTQPLANQTADERIEEGREVFRYDTFGDEAFWGEQLRLHEAIKGEDLGGVGPGVSPETALSVGLKVDAEKLPASLVSDIQAGKVNLSDPATTVALLQLDSVVGVKGFFDDDSNLTSIGITCALCHSTVDDSFAPGIGARLDGWPNRDLDVGTIISLAPNLEPVANRLDVSEDTVRTVVTAWGPGKFDAILLHDGIGFRPDNNTGAVLLPAAFGLAGVNLATYTGWGTVTYWNAFVANTEMQGQGTFYDERLNDPEKFPVDARLGTWNITHDPDLVTSKLGALHLYQLALDAPTPPTTIYDAEAAERGAELFNGSAQCSRCHVPPLYTEPGYNLHSPEDMGIDDFQASRSPTDMYRTAPLRGLWAHSQGGFFHDGRFATLEEVVDHYDENLNLNLTDREKEDLIEYLKSI